MQNGHAAFRAELGLARVAGIEKQNAVHRFRKYLVRVAENHHVRLFPGDPRRNFVRQRRRIDDVMDKKYFVRQRHDFGFLERQAEVGVADDER